MSQVIRTPRLMLIGATVEMTRASADGDHARLAELLDAHVPPDWPPPIMADAQEQLAAMVERGSLRSGKLAWYVVVHEKHLLVGFVGFKGPPEQGRIDIGYAMVDSQHGKGFATEAVGALSNWAFMDPRVQRVVAETYRTIPASMRVVEKCGFTISSENTTGFSGEKNVLQFELRREQVFGTR